MQGIRLRDHLYAVWGPVTHASLAVEGALLNLYFVESCF